MKIVQLNHINIHSKKIKHQSPVAYSADKVIQDRSKIRCDSFVLCCCTPSTTGIYVVEDKGGHLSIDKVSNQLQSGADFIYRLLNKKNDKFHFLPVLVARGIRGSTKNKLKKARIDWNGKKILIKHITTGAPLVKLPYRF